MNYYVLLGLVALSGVVNAELVKFDDTSVSPIPTLDLSPSDERELRYMNSKKKELFGEFCTTARDTYYKKINERVNDAVAVGLELMLSSVKMMVDSRSDAIVQAVETLSPKNKSSNADPKQAAREDALAVYDSNGDGKVSEDEVTEKIASTALQSEGPTRQPAKRMGFFRRLTGSIINVLKNSLGGSLSEFQVVVDKMKKKMTAENVRQTLTVACELVSTEIYGEVNTQLESHKSNLIESASQTQADETFEEYLSNIDMGTVGCLTTGRLVAANKFCVIAKGIMPIFDQFANQSP